MGALMLKATGELSEAAELLREVLQTMRETVGDQDPDTLEQIFSLAVLTHEQGDEEEAKRLCREAVDGSKAALGEGHPATLARMQNPWGIR